MFLSSHTSTQGGASLPTQQAPAPQWPGGRFTGELPAVQINPNAFVRPPSQKSKGGGRPKPSSPHSSPGLGGADARQARPDDLMWTDGDIARLLGNRRRRSLLPALGRHPGVAFGQHPAGQRRDYRSYFWPATAPAPGGPRYRRDFSSYSWANTVPHGGPQYRRDSASVPAQGSQSGRDSYLPDSWPGASSRPPGQPAANAQPPIPITARSRKFTYSEPLFANNNNNNNHLQAQPPFATTPHVQHSQGHAAALPASGAQTPNIAAHSHHNQQQQQQQQPADLSAASGLAVADPHPVAQTPGLQAPSLALAKASLSTAHAHQQTGAAADEAPNTPGVPNGKGTCGEAWDHFVAGQWALANCTEPKSEVANGCAVHTTLQRLLLKPFFFVILLTSILTPRSPPQKRMIL